MEDNPPQLQTLLDQIDVSKITTLAQINNSVLVFVSSLGHARALINAIQSAKVDRSMVVQVCTNVNGHTRKHAHPLHIGGTVGSEHLPTKTIMNQILQTDAPIANMDSLYVARHREWLPRENGNIYIHKNDFLTDRRFPIVALKPHLTFDRLNKGMSSLGEPLRYLDSAIWERRERAILAACETGENQAYHYQYYDPKIGATFWFKTLVELVSDGQEIKLTVIDDPDHREKSYWQEGYWLSRIASQPR